MQKVPPPHFLISKTGDSAPLGLEWTFKYLKQDVGVLHVVTSHNKHLTSTLRLRVACLRVVVDEVTASYSLELRPMAAAFRFLNNRIFELTLIS
jgi:hypothetical protein